MLHVVLYQPEIPHNTGAVGRLCLATGARLHLIKPLGFVLDDKHLKRAGLDYWKEVDVRVWESYEDFRSDQEISRCAMFFYTTKTQRGYWEVSYPQDACLIFGPESRGLPLSLIQAQSEQCCRIPMLGTRSLNLATTVGIALYEALRQNQFSDR